MLARLRGSAGLSSAVENAANSLLDRSASALCWKLQPLTQAPAQYCQGVWASTGLHTGPAAPRLVGFENTVEQVISAVMHASAFQKLRFRKLCKRRLHDDLGHVACSYIL